MFEFLGKVAVYVGGAAVVLAVAGGICVASVVNRTAARRVAERDLVPACVLSVFLRVDELHEEFFGCDCED